jgi:hypothetical protein
MSTQFAQKPLILKKPAAATPSPLIGSATGGVPPNPASSGQQQPFNPFQQGKNALSTGTGGRVNVDPVTGQSIARDQRVAPETFIRRARAAGGAVNEASNFNFDLPDSGAAQAQQGAMNTAGNIQNYAGQLGQAGANLIGAGADAIGSNIATTGLGAGVANMRSGQALGQLQGLQQASLNPQISPEASALLGSFGQQRMQEAGALESNLMDAFGRQRGSDLRQLAASGTLDSTTAANTLSNRDTQLGLALNQLYSQAGEKNRGDILQERGRVDEAARQFGNIQGTQATGQSGVMADLLRSQAYGASNLGSLGSEQAKQALAGMQAGGALGLQAGELGIANVNQLGNQQLAELGQRLLGQQTGLQNLESLRNNDLNRENTKLSMDYIRQLMNPKESVGFWNMAIPTTSWFDK